MNFGITSESNLEGKKNEIIQELSQRSNEYLKDKYYGAGINYFLIGLICVKPEFEFFFKVRKPKYVRRKTEKRDGISIEIENHFSYDIKISYEEFSASSDHQSKKMLVDEIIRSLSAIDDLPKDVDFNRSQFSIDLKNFLLMQVKD